MLYGIPLPIFDVIPIMKGFEFFRSLDVGFNVISTSTNLVFQVILAVLALQKFILYFFEDTRRYVELSQTKMRIALYTISLLVGLRCVLAISTYISCALELKFCTPLMGMINVWYNPEGSYTAINIFFIITACLYLPIMFSLYKMSHLRSIKESQPQKYVLWQTVALLITKLMLIPIMILPYTEDPDFPKIWYFTKLDSFTTPLAMQVTYLGCNKKNLDMVFSCAKQKLRIRKAVSVEPLPNESTISVRQINVVKMV